MLAIWLRVLCNIGFLPDTHHKPKSREISFAHNLSISYQIVLKFCTEYGSDTAVLRAKFQNDWTRYVMDERDFARFEIRMSFGPQTSMRWIFYSLSICHENKNKTCLELFQVDVIKSLILQWGDIRWNCLSDQNPKWEFSVTNGMRLWNNLGSIYLQVIHESGANGTWSCHELLHERISLFIWGHGWDV